jgi:hypothetical protein
VAKANVYGLSETGTALRKIVGEKGAEIYDDQKAFIRLLGENNVSTAIQYQLLMILSCGNIKSYLKNAGIQLTMVDINNIVQDCAAKTSLRERVVLQLVTDLLMSVNLECAIETGPVLTPKGIQITPHRLFPSGEVQQRIAAAEKALSADDTDDAAAGEARELAEAGVSKAFYLLGVFYRARERRGMTDSANLSIKYFEAAAEMGVPEAAGALGDHYYLANDPLMRDYTKAHYYYTKPGAPALQATRRAAIIDIYAQKKLNVLTLVMAGAFLAIVTVFFGVFSAGVFTGAGRKVPAVIGLALCAVLFALACLFYWLKRFDGLKWSISAMYVVWGVCALFLVLA